VVEAFKARGVHLFLLDLNGGADDVSGIVRLFLTIVSAFAEFERDRIGERIRATKRQQRARGEYLAGVAPFGWTTMPTASRCRSLSSSRLKRIRSLHARGLSPRRISADLAGRGVKLSHVTTGKIIAGRHPAA
jgi:site-specific DNA recombinase